ncbi:homocysteine inducible ER protein with ubiquitin like domain 1 [Phyllostomus discolor]|uniref:Homocysteine inducible ER protein with ubiquitin like domain 1 n=1 Tax=Phyllostomus discolor TaxID=89673 RepID=A0A834DFA6_9CHIR|nr:homocysteine inducible ER protein with ubiquitin like domain 1 [Phyllostomus discolor]
MEVEPEPVTLLVKSPNQRHRDLELSGDRSWSVGHLKAHLSRVYPERPRPEDQRLIYSGKLLLDNQCLRDLLPKQEARHVLHLVCNVRGPAKTPETSARVAESTEQPAGPHQGQYPGDAASEGSRAREALRHLPPSGWENVSRHHVGWFPFRPRPAQNFPNEGPPQEAARQDPNNNLQEGPDPDHEDPNHLPPDRDAPAGQQTSPSFMSTAWLVFKTFFASLLPEGPPAIAN